MQSTRVSAAVLISFAIAGCGKPPSAPSSPGQGSTAPGGEPILTALRVDGPGRLAPGETARYFAIATYSDGSVKDVSATSNWSPTHPSAVLYFTASGIAVGVRAGEAPVFARVGSTQASTTVLVLERGTFKLSGRVIETGDRPLQGVSIEVVSGTGAGLRATANSRGEYALYGVAGPTELRVSGEGFTPQTRDLVVAADTVADTFVLAPKEPPAAGVAADWTMTLMPSSTCPVAPAEIARGRRYQLQISRNGTALKYVISGPTVTVYNQHLNTGVVLGSHVRLYFVGDTSYGDWSSGDIYDRVSPTELMQFNGTLDGDLDGSTIRATMSGDIVYWDSTRPSFTPNWYCRAKDHAVVLRK